MFKRHPRIVGFLVATFAAVGLAWGAIVSGYVSTSTTNALVRVGHFQVDSTGTPARNFGPYFDLGMDNASGTQKVANIHGCEWLNATAGSESAVCYDKVMAAGGAAADERPVSRKYSQRAFSRAAFPAGQWSWWFQDFDNMSKDWTLTAAGTGSGAQGTTFTGGVFQASSGATNGGSETALTIATAGGPSTLIGGGSGVKFYIAARFKTTTTVDSAGVMQLGVVDSAKAQGRIFGAIGSVSTGFYVARGFSGVSGTLTSTIAIETTAFHVCEYYSDGTTQGFSCDDETPVTAADGTAGYPSIAGGPYFVAANGATSAARTLQLDWIGIGFLTN